MYDPRHNSVAVLLDHKCTQDWANGLQVCWEKFNQYFEVEGRYVPVELDYPVMSADRIEEYADENTIGIVSYTVSACAMLAGLLV